jgi:hypothetical protein
MTWMEGIGVELMLFGLIWLGWNLATSNLRAFFDLRLKVRRHIERMADPGARMSAADAHAAASEPQAAELTRELGFDLLRLAHKAPLATRFLRFLGYDAVKAGDQLVSLARDGELAFRCKSVAAALRFGTDDDALDGPPFARRSRDPVLGEPSHPPQDEDRRPAA